MKYENVYKFYGKTKVLDKFNLEIYDGEFLVVLGPSGTGKTTLLRVTVGIEEMTQGKIIIDGEDVSRLPPDKRNIAMVFQNYALYPNMTAYQNIAFPLRMAKKPKTEIKRKVEEIAETLKIAEVLEKNITLLSGGQKQRVALARALVRDPKIFLLDEPLSNLDARVRVVARGELKKIQKELGHTFVYVTHDQSEAGSMADRVAILRSGKIEQIGTYEELLNESQSTWVGDFIGDHPMNFISGNKIGLKGHTIGFRDSWVSEGTGNLSGTVELCVMGEESYHVQILLDGVKDSDGILPADQEIGTMDGFAGSTLSLRSSKKYNIGEHIRFGLNRYNVYDESGKLVECVKPS
ncbi:ABC transporter ATP-binding protein [Oxyplasma meridianum]|uniref:ABC transporter ATP-binding protein n=1 Tax=Oxyplasma meridianum TaxID=3073602 RepID=A0AAX4NDQ4_9ARCH